jgi:hypothetical protein
MRITQSLVAIAVLLMGSGSASAGVVIAETQVQKDVGGYATLHKTVYVQGRKQKIETSDRQTIIDLDKGRTFVVYPKQRSYIEMAFPPVRDETPAAPGIKFGLLTLRRTGATRSIAGYSCNEYQGEGKVAVMEVVVNQCISGDAPGAAEFLGFQSALSATLGRPPQPTGWGETGGGIALEERSIVTARTALNTPGGTAGAPVATSITMVRKIRVIRLPDATFAPPRGFHRIAPPAANGREV